MSKNLRLSLCLTVALMLGGLTLARAGSTGQQLYGITFFNHELIQIDPATGAAVQVAQLGNVTGYGLATYGGQLYTFNPNSQRIEQIDSASGSSVRSVDIGVRDLLGEGDLVIRSDGTGLLASALDRDLNPIAELIAFDLNKGTSFRLGSSGMVVDALAAEPDGTIYAIAQTEGNLYRVNSANSLELVGSLGVDQNSPFSALTVGPDGTLYASIDDRLYTVDKESGLASVVSTNVLDLSFSSVSGLAFAPTTSKSSDQLFGVTFFSHQLIAINSTNGLGNSVGDFGTVASPYGVANRFGKLYVFDAQTREIDELDPGTGAVVSAINIALPAVQGEGDLAFRSDGIGFLASALAPNGTAVNDFYQIDLINKSSIRIASTTVAIDGLAFDDNNVLFALGQGDSTLYTVNTQDGAMTRIGSLGVSQNSPFAGLTFGPNGTLYAAIDDRLFTVEKTTGAATPVDSNVLDFDFSSVSGLAFAPLPVRLMVSVSFGQLTISWVGSGVTLQTATSITGPYTVAASQANPQTVAPNEHQRFFRIMAN